MQLADNSDQNVCWQATRTADEEEEAESESMDDTSKDQLLNKEFETIWTKGTESWKTQNDEAWKVECENSGKGWEIKVGNTETVKGYCENNFGSDNSSTNLSFLALSSESGQSLRVCIQGKNCWTGNYYSDTVNTFATKSSDAWYDLKFFKV